MVSPRPVPPKRRVVELSACAKGSKTVSSLSVGMPTPVSTTSIVSVLATPADRTPSLTVTPPALGELNGVTDQVGDDLPHTGRICEDCLWNRIGAFKTQPDIFFLCSDRQDFDDLMDNAMRCAADLLQLQPTRFHFCQIENVVDQLQEGVGRSSGSYSDACASPARSCDIRALANR